MLEIQYILKIYNRRTKSIHKSLHCDQIRGFCWLKSRIKSAISDVICYRSYPFSFWHPVFRKIHRRRHNLSTVFRLTLRFLPLRSGLMLKIDELYYIRTCFKFCRKTQSRDETGTRTEDSVPFKLKQIARCRNRIRINLKTNPLPG